MVGQHPLHLIGLVRRAALPLELQRERPVQGARVHVQQPETHRDLARHRALAGGRRTVDGDDEAHVRLPRGPRSGRPAHPASAAHRRTPGRRWRWQEASSTVTGPVARVPITAKAMAMRWSPWERTVPRATGPPWMSSPSGVSSTCTPSAAQALGQRVQPVALLDPQLARAAQARGAVGRARRHGPGGDLVQESDHLHGRDVAGTQLRRSRHGDVPHGLRALRSRPGRPARPPPSATAAPAARCGIRSAPRRPP